MLEIKGNLSVEGRSLLEGRVRFNGKVGHVNSYDCSRHYNGRIDITVIFTFDELPPLYPSIVNTNTIHSIIRKE